MSSSAASRDKRRQHANYDDYYQYGYQYDSNPDYSYSQQEAYDVVEERKCYVCEYTVLSSQNHQEGLRECMDPFDGKDVPEIECSGPCAVCYFVILILFTY